MSEASDSITDVFLYPEAAEKSDYWQTLQARFPFLVASGVSELEHVGQYYVIKHDLGDASEGLSHYGLVREPLTPTAASPVLVILHAGFSGITPDLFPNFDSLLGSEWFRENAWCIAPTFPGEPLGGTPGGPYLSSQAQGRDIEAAQRFLAACRSYFGLGGELRVFGRSRGASAGYSFAILTPEVKRVGLVSGAANWWLNVVKYACILYAETGGQWQESPNIVSFINSTLVPYLTDPPTKTREEVRDAIFGRSPGLWAGYLPSNLTILHGSDDVIVHVDHSRWIAGLLRGYRACFDYIETPGVGHNEPENLDGWAKMREKLIG